jgi:hypothetical protein
MEFFELTVNDGWIQLAHRAVCKYLETWPGGDPEEQEAYVVMKNQLDKLMLEVAFQHSK